MELFANNPQTTVSAGGTTAPGGGTVETWTVSSSAGFPAASSANATVFHVSDPALPTEIVAVTNVSGSTWTVTRGAEGSTPVAHTTGFTVKQVVTAGVFSALLAQVTPSGDSSGVTDNAVIQGMLNLGFNVKLAPGNFFITGINMNTNALAQLSVEAAGPGTNVFVVGGGTGFNMHRASGYGAQFGLPADATNGKLRGFTVDGTNATSGAIGVDVGDGWGYDIDLVIVNFSAPNCIALNLINRVFWSEKNRVNAHLMNNANSVVIDCNVPGGSLRSHEYCDFTFYLFCNPGQQGVVIQNGAYMSGSSLRVRGNFGTSATVLGAFSYTATNASPCVFTATGSALVNGTPVQLSGGSPPTGFSNGTTFYVTGASGTTFKLAATPGGPAMTSTSTGNGTVTTILAALTIQGSDGAGNWSSIQRCLVDFVVESNLNSTNGPFTVWFGNASNNMQTDVGNLVFQFSPWTNTNATSGQVQLVGSILNTDTALQNANTVKWTAQNKPAAPLTSSPANPATTTSTTLVMMGLGVTYTPNGSGNVLVIISGGGRTNTAITTFQVGARFGTGTAPVNGAAVTGTRLGGIADPNFEANVTAGAAAAFTFSGVPALTPGTTYWFDLALATGNAADAAVVNNITVSIIELP